MQFYGSLRGTFYSTLDSVSVAVRHKGQACRNIRNIQKRCWGHIINVSISITLCQIVVVVIVYCKHFADE